MFLIQKWIGALYKVFFAQIKGTHHSTEINGGIRYSLKSLAFPAFIASDVTLDPGLLFLVLNPDARGEERIFFKYMSVDFLNSIDFDKESMTINFTDEEEILNTDESLNAFCKKLESIASQHSFINKLSEKQLDKNEIDKIIVACNKYITSQIELIETVGLLVVQFQFVSLTPVQLFCFKFIFFGFRRPNVAKCCTPLFFYKKEGFSLRKI